MRKTIIATLVVTAFALPGLAQADEGGAAAGAVSGAVAGGIVGGPVGAAVGAGVGGVAGGAASGPDRRERVIERGGPGDCSSKTVRTENAYGDSKTVRTESCD
jgi:phage tail tape-measure protein